MEADPVPPPEQMEVGNSEIPVKSVESAPIPDPISEVQNQDFCIEKPLEPEMEVPNGNGASLENQEMVASEPIPENLEQISKQISEDIEQVSQQIEQVEQPEMQPEEVQNQDKIEDNQEDAPKAEEKDDIFGKLLSSGPIEPVQPEPEPEYEDDKKEDIEDEPANDDNISNHDEMEDENPLEESEEKKEENEVKNEEDDKKDSFDKMLDSNELTEESSAAITEGTKEESEDKTELNSAPATLIASLDTLEEMTKGGNSTEEDEVIITTVSEKVKSDEKYYDELKAEELEYLQTNMPTIESVCCNLSCCVCGKKVDPIVGTAKGVQRHPHLGVSLCASCRKFYGDGDWPQLEDGDEYCRMCGQGGDILLCDKCPNAFCKKCLSRNLGARALREITKSEEWSCLMCDSTPIYPLKAAYYCVYKKQDEIKEKRKQDRENAKLKKLKKPAIASSSNAIGGDVTAKEKETLVKSPQNFLEENISEAFKTLEVYQKSLEAERVRCIQTVKEGMSVEMATSITRKLRKLYAVTQKNMDLLDRAIVESYVENFPTDSTRIHMGRVAPAQPPPMPRIKRTKKKQNTKKKTKTKSKKHPPGAGPNKGKKGRPKKGSVIQMNGSPIYAEADNYVVPSLKKRRKYAESDVECVDLSEDEEYYHPKKKMRPGPASAKKGKPGPASKKKMGPKSKTDYY